jgi:hypothetical protein
VTALNTTPAPNDTASFVRFLACRGYVGAIVIVASVVLLATAAPPERASPDDLVTRTSSRMGCAQLRAAGTDVFGG